MRAEHRTDVGFLKGMSILFVDDSSDERDLFELRIGMLGADVTAVESVVQALGVLERGETDLVVTDIVLPDLSGYDLLRAMHERAPECGAAIPALAVTGFVATDEVSEPMRAGFDVVLVKPYSTDDLVWAIDSVKSRVAKLRELRQQVAQKSSKQRALRDRLADRQRRLQRERAQLRARYGPAAEKASAAREFVRLTAEDFGESFCGGPVGVVDVMPLPPLEPASGRWLARVARDGVLLALEIALDAKVNASIRMLDAE